MQRQTLKTLILLIYTFDDDSGGNLLDETPIQVLQSCFYVDGFVSHCDVCRWSIVGICPRGVNSPKCIRLGVSRYGHLQFLEKHYTSNCNKPLVNALSSVQQDCSLETPRATPASLCSVTLPALVSYQLIDPSDLGRNSLGKIFTLQFRWQHTPCISLDFQLG